MCNLLLIILVVMILRSSIKGALVYFLCMLREIICNAAWEVVDLIIFVRLHF